MSGRDACLKLISQFVLRSASGGMNDVSNLRSSCSPYCTTEQVDDVRPKLTVARVGLGVGGVAAIAAVVVYLTRPTVEVERRAPPPAQAWLGWKAGAVEGAAR